MYKFSIQKVQIPVTRTYWCILCRKVLYTGNL